MIFDTERTLSSYIIEDRRYHSEGEGGDININNICLILVSFAAVASVLKKNIEHMRYSNILIVSLYLSVGVVLLIGATRSALIFFLVLIFYNFFNSYTRVMFKVMFVLILFLIIFSFGIAQFGLDFVFLKRFLDYDYLSSQRTLMSINSLSMFVDHPIFGVGMKNFTIQQSLQFDSQDHNFYTKLLGSNGIIGFLLVMLFYIGLTKTVAQKIQGIYILKGLFFYIFIFIPAGPGTLIIAATIHYLSDLQVKKSLQRSRKIYEKNLNNYYIYN